MILYPVAEAGSRRVTRRSFLAGATSLAAAALWSSRAVGAMKRHVKLADYPFQLGVASGDPMADGMVLWTRLAPKPLDGGGMPDQPIEVAWQVAEDEAMTKVVREGTTAAVPDWAHSVHVEVDGLRPDRWYHYQFKGAGEVSPKGRTRTMPAADASPDKLRLAVASCQHFEEGLFTAYEHMARDDFDLVLHLGDYIYEQAGQDKRVRKHLGPEIMTLADYRTRHAQYRGDAALQAMHAAAPWVVTWDDHELDDNCAGAISKDKGVSAESFLRRRAASYQAYYEHMPLRRTSLPNGPDMKIYRRIAFGRLAELFALDTRQYRTDQPCGDGNKPPCDAVLAPQATILGDAQEQWLHDSLAASQGRWNVLAQQVPIARVDMTPGDAVAYSMDKWAGYELNRRRLLKHFDEQRISNPVSLAGDMHTNWANNLIADFEDLESKVMASEFVATSISSGGNGVRNPKNLATLMSENPFVKFHNAERGYLRCDITPRQWRTDYQVVEDVTKPGGPLVTRASFVVENHRPGILPA